MRLISLTESRLLMKAFFEYVDVDQAQLKGLRIPES